MRPPVVLDVVAAGAAVSVPAKPSLIEHSSQYQFSGRGGLRFTHERWNCEEEERGHDDDANANNVIEKNNGRRREYRLQSARVPYEE